MLPDGVRVELQLGRGRSQTLFPRPQVSVPGMQVGELVGDERLTGPEESSELIIAGLESLAALFA
jgi:hypothetical protein